MSGIELLALGVFSILVLGIYAFKEKRLADPSDSRVIYSTQMSDVMMLPEQKVHAVLLRQSGNIYKELGQFDTPRAAVVEIEKSFRRAKIDSVAVLRNSTDKFEVLRLHHSHGGKAEGKKLGGAAIELA